MFGPTVQHKKKPHCTGWSAELDNTWSVDETGTNLSLIND